MAGVQSWIGPDAGLPVASWMAAMMSLRSIMLVVHSAPFF
jgi:hypothetical protein